MPRAAAKKTKPVRARKPRSKVSHVLPLRPSGPSVTHGHALHLGEISSHHSRDEKSQRLIMWLGISVVMAIIVGAWILNLNQVIGPDAFSTKTEATESAEDLKALRDDLQSAFSEVKEDLKQFEALTQTSPGATPAVTSTILPNTLPN